MRERERRHIHGRTNANRKYKGKKYKRCVKKYYRLLGIRVCILNKVGTGQPMCRYSPFVSCSPRGMRRGTSTLTAMAVEMVLMYTWEKKSGGCNECLANASPAGGTTLRQILIPLRIMSLPSVSFRATLVFSSEFGGHFLHELLGNLRQSANNPAG